MKKTFIATLGALGLLSGGAAQAQDWSGLYTGFSLGSGSRDTTWTDLDDDWEGFGVVADTSDKAGLVAGPVIGFNWQSHNVVLGVQGDLSYTDLSSSGVGDQCGCVTIHTDMQWLATGRVNVGYSFGSVLPYVTAGVAISDLQNSWTEASDPTDSWEGVDSDAAIMYGAGIKYAALERWAFGIEAMHYDFGGVTSRNQDGYRMTIDNEVDIVQATATFKIK